MSEQQSLNGDGTITIKTSSWNRVVRERDEARESLKHISEYGTDEINAAVELRQKLATALLERDEAREELKIALEQWELCLEQITKLKNEKN
jgi:hypothetical protein